MNKRLLRSDKFALGTGRTCVRPECSVARERVQKGPASTAKEYFLGRPWRTSPSFEGSRRCHLRHRRGRPERAPTDDCDSGNDLDGRDGVVQKVLTHRRHSSHCSRATGAGRGSKRRMWITEKDRTVLEFMEKIWDGSAVTRRHMGSGLRVSSSLGAVVHDRSKMVGGSGDGKTESEVAA
jgi:hypothetical protein